MVVGRKHLRSGTDGQQVLEFDIVTYSFKYIDMAMHNVKLAV